jgi:hypothetical protein
VSYLIENLQRRHEWYRALEAQNQALHGARPRKSDPLGFEFEEIQFLRRHAIQEFLHDAELGRQEMVLLEEHLRRPLSVFPRDEFAVKLAESYARAIKRATGEYADLLTQVLLSRTRVRSFNSLRNSARPRSTTRGQTTPRHRLSRWEVRHFKSEIRHFSGKE